MNFRVARKVTTRNRMAENHDPLRPCGRTPAETKKIRSGQGGSANMPCQLCREGALSKIGTNGLREMDERDDEFRQLVEAHLQALMERGFSRERAFEILRQRLVNSRRAAFRIVEND